MTYLQKLSGDSIENPTFLDIEQTIDEIQKLDQEHAAFWYGTDEEELVLEVHGDLTGFLGVDGDDSQYKIKFGNWTEIAGTFAELLNGKWDAVKLKFGILQSNTD